MSTLYQHFEYWKKCPPHYSTMVSVLFHHISMPEKCLPYYSTMVPALFQQSSALFPLIFSLKIVSAQHINPTNVSTLFQQSPKKWWLYSNMKVSTLLQFISILKKYLPYPLNFFCPVTEVECLPYYNIVSVLLKFSVHFIPTPELSAPLQYAVCLIVGTP